MYVFFFFPGKKKRAEKEQFCLLCLDEGVVPHATDNRFTFGTLLFMHSALQSLTSMEKLTSPPLIYYGFVFRRLFNIGTKCQNERSQKNL